MFSLFVVTLLNVFIIIDSKSVVYQINDIGQRGIGKNKKSYVEVIKDDGKLEKINLPKSFIKSLTTQETVKLRKHTSLFGLVYHDQN